MNPALETLMLAFSANERFAVPGRALFIGAEPHPELVKWPDLIGWQALKPRADEWDKNGFTRVNDLPDGRWPAVLVLPGKSRDEILASFGMARGHLEAGGRLFAAIPNTTGAARFEKELARATGNIASIQKHKCRAFYALEDGNWDEDLFGKWRELGNIRKMTGSEFTTQAGVFSSDHIDPGSQLLVEHLPGNLRGTVADLGAGWGFLSVEALRRSPRIERIDLFEVDSRALACARLNLAGHERATFHWHDVTAGLPGSYDTILMNPPFHTGHATHVDLGRVFLKTAADSLRRGGSLFLVANRQLPYEAVLDSTGLVWSRLAEDKTYKLLLAKKR